MTTVAPDVTPEPVLPAYGSGSIAEVVPALLARGRSDSDALGALLPPAARTADQVVLLVLDGLGWEQLRARPHLAPTLSSAAGVERPITSIAPTTTAAALTSITTGTPPSRHGILGYRLAEGDQILNMLRWTLGPAAADARQAVPATAYQQQPPFAGSPQPVPVVSKADFGGTGFTAAHLGDAPMLDYRVPSSLPVEVSQALGTGAPLVYAYYDGIDRVAHAHGLGAHYDAELRATDRLVAEIVSDLPSGAVVVVTADHGQIDVGAAVEVLGRDAMALVRFFSGEGRFRWLHARPGAAADLLALAAERYGATTWVRSRDQVVDEGWFGGPLTARFAERLGDVVLAPHAAIAFADPADTGENRLRARHGSLTPDEMLVPLLALGGER